MSATLWRVTPDQVVRYTEGDCWLLAFELGRLLDAPLVSICDPLDQNDWCHVAVDLGCETLLDAVGVHSRVDLSLIWERRSKGLVAFRELGRFYSLDAYLRCLDGERLAAFVSRQDEDNARQFAHTIASALTEGFHDYSSNHDHDHDHNHFYRWTSRCRKE